MALLNDNRIEVLADVRSYPHSKYSPQFDRASLERAAKDQGIKYLFLGDELGGRPPGDEFYDAQGHVLYAKVARVDFFRNGIERLKQGAQNYRVAIMCSEENPTDCHRRLLVGRVLTGESVNILHIRGSGQVQPEQEVAAGDRREPLRGQGMLFAEMEDAEFERSRPELKRANAVGKYRSLKLVL